MCLRVMVKQVVGEVMEKVGGVRREETIVDHINGFFQLRVGFIVLPRLVAMGLRCVFCVHMCVGGGGWRSK